MVPTRREVLAASAISVSGVTGCLASGGPDLVIENDLEQSVTANTDITRMSDMVVTLQTERSIGPDETIEFPNLFEESAEYRIQITTPEANSGGETTVQVENDESVEIRATIGPDGVTFTTASQ
jgi:hypothetical protein